METHDAYARIEGALESLRANDEDEDDVSEEVNALIADVFDFDSTPHVGGGPKKPKS